ncbi:MAG: hypothetical protein JKX78_02950 [Alteromonadaceae bacterium]|nr:hypothetical protein [Alteromonadaceae bacterium]
MKFTVCGYDRETHGTFSDAAHSDGDFFTIAQIEEQTTWRELRLIEQSLRKAELIFDGKNVIGMMVINDTDTSAFALGRLLENSEKRHSNTQHPQRVAEALHLERTTTELIVNASDIHALMQLLPLGNSSHSGVREKLHQASLELNKKR